MDDLLQKLKEWIRVIEAALLGTIIVEGALVIIIGIASNRAEVFNLWLAILIGCSLVYLFLLTVKAAYQLKFPGSIVDELLSKRQLEEKNKLFDRQKAINEYINSAIRGLNKQTCFINRSEEIQHLCDQELGSRLSELLQPIISYTDVILDTSTEKKFTIGVHLDAYHRFPASYDEIELDIISEYNVSIVNWDPIQDNGILILKDELLLTELLPKGLVDADRANDALYEIQATIKRSLNNLNFNSHDFTYNHVEYTIICCEILEVCSDDYVNGVLFIIFKKGINYPGDVPEILRIFNRIAANYVSKYNTCIYHEVISKKSQIMIEESKKQA